MPLTHKLLLLLMALAAAAPARAQEASPQKPVAPVQSAAADDDFARGKRLLERGDAAGAAAAFKAAAERRRNDPEAWYHLGLALTHANRNKEARKAFEKAAELNPGSAQARTGLAYALLATGKTREAEREAAAALRLDPQQPDARYVLGAVRLREDKFEQSAREAEEALRIRGDHRAAAVLAGRALLSLYGEESDRVAQQHPLPLPGDVEARRRAHALREERLEPLKARLRAAAERLERLVGSAPGAGELGELVGTLKTYSRQPQNKEKEAGQSDIFRLSDVTTKAVIHAKPEPAYTDRARDNGTSGTVRLRVVLAADGSVKDILVLRRLPDGLTERAVEAARRIKFTPATIDGRPVSQYVVLEYMFRVGY